MIHIHNLQPKSIKEFTVEDTIYVSIQSGRNNSTTYLAQFVSYKVGVVTVKKIKSTVNEKLHSGEAGEEAKVRIPQCALYGNNPVNGWDYFHWFKGSGYAIYPKDYMKQADNADIIEEHESFGLVGLSRRNSRGSVLFGSSIDHQNVIALTIKTADVKRDLKREWYHGISTLIEIEMSQSQFSECITSPNIGEGVPCTIRYIGNERILDPPYENKKDQFKQEFKNAMTNISTDLSENRDILQSILEKKSIGKADKEEISRLFGIFINKIGDSIPFIQSSFSKQMDKSVTEAKAEVEAFINQRVTEEGRKQLLGGDGKKKLLN
jgi:hypothetical protein